ncbi:hypothetical protein [Photobacterium damselae]|uniref:hypothetical protein n=1 Tax=Photobacterium damselae TaxID=38293 RepID=UPI0040685253
MAKSDSIEAANKTMKALFQLLNKHCTRGVAVMDPHGGGIDSIWITVQIPEEEQEAFKKDFWQTEPFKTLHQFFSLSVYNLPWYKCRLPRSKYQVFISHYRQY